MRMESQKRRAERISEAIESGDVIVFYRSVYSCTLWIVCLFIFLLLAVWLTRSFPILTIESHFFGYRVPTPVLFPLVLGFFGYIIHCLFNMRYEIGPDYVRSQEGILSLSKKDMRILMIDIRGIELNRGALGRVFNYGNIEIGSAMHGELEVLMRGVYDPSWYRDIIIGRRHLVEKALAAEVLARQAAID